MNNKKPSFSLYGFKKWIFEQKDLSNFFDIKPEEIESEDILETTVYPSINKKKLLEKIKTNADNIEELIEDFKENGGIVKKIKGKSIIVEVEKGTFALNKNYVKN